MRIKKILLGKMDKKRFIKSFHRLCAHGIVFASVFVLFHDPEAVQNNGKDLQKLHRVHTAKALTLIEVGCLHVLFNIVTCRSFFAE